MEIYLIPAALVLALTNISFAVLANHWRKQAKQLQTKNDLLLLRWNKHRDRTLADGVVLGEQRAYGRMYAAAVRADRRGVDILVALRAAGCGLEAEADEQDVQVLGAPGVRAG